MGFTEAEIPSELKTASLVLQALVIEDAPLMFEAYAKDPEVARYMSWKLTGDFNDTLSYITSAVQWWASRDHTSDDFAYAIRLASTGELIGCCTTGPHTRSNRFHWGIGYNLARQHWGKGYGTEAVTAVSRMTLDIPGVFRVSAVVDVENEASSRVLEKSGFQREGILRRYSIHPNVSDQPRDIFMFSMVK